MVKIHSFQLLKIISTVFLCTLLIDQVVAQDGSENSGFTSLGFTDNTEYGTSIIQFGDGDYLIAGNFTMYGTDNYNRIIRLNNDGTIDSDNTFNTNILSNGGFNGRVNDMEVFIDGLIEKVVVVGNFSDYNGNAVNSFVILNTSDGSISLNPSTGLDGEVFTVKRDENGKFLLGGNFTQYDGNNVGGITRISADGTLDTFGSLNDGILGGTGVIYDIETQSDGKIIIAGAFDTYNSNTVNGIARLDANGGYDASFDVGSTIDNSVESFDDIEISSAGLIVVGGTFLGFGDASGWNAIIVLNDDGTMYSSFSPSSGADDGNIASIALTSDNKIIAGGGFDTFNGSTVNKLVKLNLDGSIDTSFDASALSINSQINKLVITADNNVLITGGFTDPNPAGNIAVVNNSNLYVVTNTNDSGPGSLRWCITNANSSSGETITFNIPGAGPWTISPTTNLPQITSTMIIDATSQSGWSSTNLVGISKGGAEIGLDVNANDVEIYGLEIRGFNNSSETAIYTRSGVSSGIIGDVGKGNVIGGNYFGLRMTGSNVIVKSNKIGTDNSGTMANANYAGIYISGGGFNQIGGNYTIDEGNLISGNSMWGIRTINSNNNVIQGNYVGTDITGYVALPNDWGIEIGWGTGNESTDNTIGGTATGEGNLISGNTNSGLRFLTGSSNVVYGNIIGLDKDGLAAIANNYGISLGFTNSYPANNNIIGGSSAGQANVIAGNTSSNVIIYNGSGNTLQGNNVGVDINGNPIVAATAYGVRLVGFSTSPVVDNNIIGGLGVGEGNIIAGHTYGVSIDPGDGTANGNTIRGNEIYCNSTKGISLATGANNSIAAPTITDYDTGTGAVNGTCVTCVTGELIDVYRDNSGCSPIQGGEYLGTVVFSTSPWSLTGLTLNTNDIITATVTDGSGNTSPFSVTDPEIEVYDGVDNSGTLLVDGSSTIDAGFEFLGNDLVKSITIENLGMEVLNISSITTSNANFAIAGSPSTVGFNATATFTVSLTSQPVGIYSTTITINNNDPDENPFTFTISAIITEPDFYSLGSSTFDDPNNWQTAQGINPPNFTDITQNFIIQNGHTITSPSSDININNLTIQDGGVFQNGNRDIAINGATSISGTFDDNVSNGSTTFLGSITVTSTGSFTVTGSNTSFFYFHGNIVNEGVFNLTNSTQWFIESPLSIQNRSATVFNLAQPNSGVGNINADLTILDFAGGGSINLHSNSHIRVADGITLRNELGDYPTNSRRFNITEIRAVSGTATVQNGAGAILVIDAGTNATNDGLTYDFSETDNLVIYDFSGNQNILDANHYHLWVRNALNKSLANNIIINGNLDIGSNTTFNSNNFNVAIAGNWINRNATNGFVQNTGTVTFNGADMDPQTISGQPTTFTNLTINNSGSSSEVQAQVNVAVENTLTLNNGLFTVSDGTRLDLGIGVAAITGVFGSNRMISIAPAGIVRKYFDTDGSFEFPIGTTGVYTPITTSFNTGTIYNTGSSYADISLVAVEEPNVLTSGLSITKYWSLSTFDMSNISADVQFTYDDTEIPGTSNELIYLAGYYNGSSWLSTAGVDPATNTGIVSFSNASSIDGFYTAGELEAFVAPPAQASDVIITYPSITTESLNVSWTSTANSLVLVKEGSAVDADPSDLATYVANAAFSSGDEIGTGNYVMYNGSGSSFTITGLAPESEYYFKVYSYNGSAGSENYNVDFSGITNNPVNLTFAPFTVTTTDDSGVGSLRWAITNANTSPDGGTIRFNIPGAGPWTINPSTNLPQITAVMTLDATTQPGWAHDNRVIIENVSSSTIGLEINTSDVNVYGFEISGFNGGGHAGIEIQGGVSYVTIGGLHPDLDTYIGNILVNNYAGIDISGNVSDITIKSNYIGLENDGVTVSANISGVYSVSSGISNSVIGGTSDGEGNIIAGSSQHQMLLTNATNNIIQGNKIGVDVLGNVINSSGEGIRLYTNSQNNIIGGTGPGEANHIAGNTFGVTLHPLNGNVNEYNTIRGNEIYCNDIGIHLVDNGGVDNAANDNISAPDVSGFNNGTGEIEGTCSECLTTGYTIDLYTDYTDCTPGQGRKYIGEVLNAGTSWTFSSALLGDTTRVVATVTDPLGNTSPFSVGTQDVEVSYVDSNNDFYELGFGNAVDFGTLDNTQDSTINITVKNIGTEYLNYYNITSTDYSAFSLISSSGTLKINDSIQFSIAVNTGLSAATYNATISVSSDDPDEATTAFNISVTITSPDMNITHESTLLSSGDAIGFGDNLMSSNPFQTVTIANSGNADLIITDLLFDNTNFSTTATTPLVVSTGGSIDISVDMNDTAVGNLSGQLTIQSNDPLGDFVLLLSGNIVAPALEVAHGADVLTNNGTLDFGIRIQNSAPTETIIITNIGTSSLTIDEVAVSGNFSLVDAFTPTVLAIGQPITLEVRMGDANISDALTGLLTLMSNDPNGDFAINLSGSIEADNGQQISVIHEGEPLISAEGLIDFGDVQQGETTSITISIENTGTNELVVTEIILADGTVFSIEGLDFPITLAPGEGFDITILLNTANIGLFGDVITIVSNDPSLGNFDINVSANIIPVPVPAIAVFNQLANVSGTVDFGTVDKNNTTQFTFDIHNTGTANLEISAISSSESHFSIAAINLPATVQPGEQTPFNIVFDATAVGVFESEIVVTSNDPVRNNYTFFLRGVVSGGRVVLVITNPDNTVDRVVISNEDIDLGQTNVNVSIEKIFGIENLSDTEEIFINSITVDNPGFTVHDIPASVPAQGFEQFRIVLNARAVGVITGSVTVSTTLNDFSFGITGEVINEGNPPLGIYNVITPNSDGIHDFFKIDNISFYPDNRVIIYNRWGDKVFEISGYDNAKFFFNGTSNTGGGEIDAGNYYYSIDKGNGSKVLTGYLFIKR